MSDTSRIVRTPRVYDLAREIGVGSHVVKNLLNTLGFEVKSFSSRVNIEELDESPIFMQLFTDTCIDTYLGESRVVRKALDVLQSYPPSPMAWNPSDTEIVRHLNGDCNCSDKDF